MSSDIKTEKITAMFIVEAMGRPKEHLTETLEDISQKIAEEKGVKITEKKIHEAKEIEGKKDLFSTFMEVEVEVEDQLMLPMLMFKYMPAHVEVLEPEHIRLTNNDYGEILTQITRTLHKYDELARVLQMEKGILENQLRHLIEKSKK